MTLPPKDVTLLLQAVHRGENGADDALAERVYEELRRLAGGMMRRERVGQTLHATALVSEAWMALAGGAWHSRRQFFGAAAQAMRRLLVDAARRRAAEKRGGGAAKVTFQDLAAESPTPRLDLLALDEALVGLENYDPRLAETVRLRYFAGLTIAEVADLQHSSVATVKRDWTYARAWLLERIDGSDLDPADG